MLPVPFLSCRQFKGAPRALRATRRAIPWVTPTSLKAFRSGAEPSNDVILSATHEPSGASPFLGLSWVSHFTVSMLSRPWSSWGRQSKLDPHFTDCSVDQMAQKWKEWDLNITFASVHCSYKQVLKCSRVQMNKIPVLSTELGSTLLFHWTKCFRPKMSVGGDRRTAVSSLRACSCEEGRPSFYSCAERVASASGGFVCSVQYFSGSMAYGILCGISTLWTTAILYLYFSLNMFYIYILNQAPVICGGFPQPNYDEHASFSHYLRINGDRTFYSFELFNACF